MLNKYSQDHDFLKDAVLSNLNQDYQARISSKDSYDLSSVVFVKLKSSVK